MSTNYPSAIDTYSTKIDLVTDVMAADINNPQDAIIAIETELGLDPRGSYTDVAARITDYAARIANLEIGWVALPTCTYVSTTSFTLAGNWTSILKGYTKWKGYNASQKFGYIFSSTYSSVTGLTTVNLVANTSYALASGAISDAYISYANPVDFPYWMSYVAVLSTDSGTFTSASASGKFSIHGKTCEADLPATIVTNGTASGIKISVPFTSVGTFVLHGRENQATGVTLQGLLPSGAAVVSVFNYAGSNINANGIAAYMNGFFAIA